LVVFYNMSVAAGVRVVEFGTKVAVNTLQV